MEVLDSSYEACNGLLLKSDKAELQRYFAYMYICIPHACLVPMEPEEGTRSPGIGVTDG
ncbi:hypothetical protein STEG23_028083, partial [Scotinomys teguina]